MASGSTQTVEVPEGKVKQAEKSATWRFPSPRPASKPPRVVIKLFGHIPG